MRCHSQAGATPREHQHQPQRQPATSNTGNILAKSAAGKPPLSGLSIDSRDECWLGTFSGQAKHLNLFIFIAKLHGDRDTTRAGLLAGTSSKPGPGQLAKMTDAWWLSVRRTSCCCRRHQFLYFLLFSKLLLAINCILSVFPGIIMTL